MGVNEKIYEIRIKKVSDLSPEAQKEVQAKLKDKPDNFNFQGYAKVTYAHCSPVSVVSVDPISGSVLSFFKSISEQVSANIKH